MNAIEWTLEMRFAVAVALGFLVGLERESTKLEFKKLIFGGVRTHPIISMFGFGCAWLYRSGSAFILPAGLLALAGLTVVAYMGKMRNEQFGSTSEMSALLTFLVGALALLADIWISMATGVLNAVLLSEKSRLEAFVEKLDKVEFLATLKFLVVTVIVLPVLPNQDYTRFHINPANVWKIVILVSSVGFVGYLLTKRFGARTGLWLSGLLGGIVSSTAVTFAMGHLAQSQPSRAKPALQGAILASSVMYLRILILVVAIAPAFLDQLGWRCAVLTVAGVLLSLRIPGEDAPSHGETGGLHNPFEITPALVFAGLFVGLSVVTTFMREAFGHSGMLVMAGLVGVTDIDPFILSIVQQNGDVFLIVLQAILIAMMANTLVKGFYFAFLVPEKRPQALLRYGIWAALHLPLIVRW